MPRTYVFTAFGGPESQQFIDLPKPKPGAGQLLVRVKAAGVNPADWKQRMSLAGTADPSAGPTPMGREVAGTVEEVGEGVTGFAVGDAVFGSVVANGAWSEYSVTNADITAHKPESVSFFDAATLPVAAATAYDGVHQLNLAPGQTLLVTGIGGGVGLAIAQIARELGIHVIGTASASKKELVESVGATPVVYGDGAVDRVRTAAPNGVDALYDLIGGDALRELSPLVTDKSKIISAADRATLAEVGGSPLERARNSAVLDAVASMVAAGTLKPFVTKVYPLDQVGEALALVESGHSTGKVVVEVS